MTPTQRVDPRSEITRSIQSMSVEDATKTLRQGAVNLLDEYLRVMPANNAVLITSTNTDNPDLSLMLNNGMPQHIADGVAGYANQIKHLLAQASAMWLDSAAAAAQEIQLPEAEALKGPFMQTSPDELHGAIRADPSKASLPSSAAPSHNNIQPGDPTATSPAPSVDSLGGPLRAIQPAHDNAANTLVNIHIPPVPAIPPTELAAEVGEDGASPLALGPRKGARTAARAAADENVPMDRLQRISYVLPYADNNVNGVDDGYRWRKYGRKTVAGQNYQRHYFKCSNSTCGARRHTECYPPDPTKIQVTYEPTPHNHPPPFVQAAEAFAQALKQEGYPPNPMWILGASTPATLPAPPRPRTKASRAPRTAPEPIPAAHLTFMEAVLPTDPSVPLPRFEPLDVLPPPLLEGPRATGKRSRAVADPMGAWDSDASAEADVMIFADAISRMQVWLWGGMALCGGLTNSCVITAACGGGGGGVGRDGATCRNARAAVQGIV